MKTGSNKKEDTLSPNVQAQRWEQLARPMPLGASEVTSTDVSSSAWLGSVDRNSAWPFKSIAERERFDAECDNQSDEPWDGATSRL